MKKLVCIASTPYHILNLFNILTSEEYCEACIDVIVTGEVIVKQVEVLKECLNIRRIINLSFFYEDLLPNNRFLRKIVVAYNMLQGKNKTKKLKLDTDYDEILVSHPAIPTYNLVSYFWKANPKIRVSFYEDGVGTYNAFGCYRNDYLEKIYKMVFKFDFYNSVDAVFIYRTDMFDSNGRTVEVKKIELSNRIDHYITFYKSRFKESIDIYENARAIFFDEVMLFYDEKLMNKEIEIINELGSIIEKEQFIFKPHPRAINKKMNIECKLAEDNLPFEIIMMSLSNVEDKILITTWSTACVSPKLILNKEPLVISIGKILNEESEITRIYRKTKNVYSNGNRFAIVNTLEEANNLILAEK